MYFAPDGHLVTGQESIGNTFYYADSNGIIQGVYNNAVVICQRPQLPTGCEITAVTMMLKFAGYNVNKITLAEEMPRSNNPNKGFVGNPFSATGWWIYPHGIASVINHYIGYSDIMTGCSLNQIKEKLLHGHLVVVWVANFDGFVNHALALTGYRKNILYYNDPWLGCKDNMTINQFYQHWNADDQRAISY